MQDEPKDKKSFQPRDNRPHNVNTPGVMNRPWGPPAIQSYSSGNGAAVVREFEVREEDQIGE